MTPPVHWIVTYYQVGSRGTTFITRHTARNRLAAYYLAAQLITKDRRRTGGLTLTITKESP